ncbi:MAG: trypsin-like peptidase domain-containing protein [Lachnospiraceae bacterium]|nr:trypsin-like peptidase domain-containing protein [Lachnospiraceae bacterium]
MPSVVSITNTAVITQNFWGQTLQSENESSGSGFIVGENESELLIVSNNHVIADSDTLKVQFIDGSVVEARVKGVDSNMDLAVIAVSVEDLSEETLSSISIAKLGNSDTLKVGEPAIAIGNALGYGQSVTTGVISALNRQLEMMEEGATSSTLIQTDAAINPGNSGGALLNVRGEVIGINSNKIGGSAIEGMGYAIPISSAKPIIEQLMSRETKDKVKEENKGYLGISGLDVTSDVSRMYGMPEGVYVAQVYEGSGAAGAGMLKGDIITAFDGSTVGSMSDLQGYLQYYEAGETVTVQLQRPNAGGYVEQIVEVILGKQSMFAEDR